MSEEQNAGASGENIPRRDFIRKIVGAGAATVLPLRLTNSALAQTNTPQPNLYDNLKKFQFMDQDGKPVDIDALKKSLLGNEVTLSYGFSTCTAYCPYINGALGELHKKKPAGLTSIVIAVQPKEDGESPATRSEFMNIIRVMMDIDRSNPKDGKVIILYPVNQSKQLDDSITPLIEESFGNIVNLEQPKLHSPSIAFYGPTGNFLQRKLAPIAQDLPNNPPQKFINDCLQTLNSPGR